MTDAEIIKVNECKTLAEGEKIKAIYPHIVVGGQTEKPCYSIQWYDIEKKTMLDGYASYKLEFVKKWLQENFEEIEFDIGDLINRQKAEIERLNKEVNRLSECVLYHDGHIVDAIKEFVVEIEAELAGYELHFIEIQDWSARNTIRQVISAIKEMVGDTEC